jgi:DNA polymerase III epsilon subunit-like protein
MSPNTPNYLARARELRVQRLEQAEPPVPRLPAQTGRTKKPERKPTMSPDTALKATRKHALITTPNRLAELTVSLADAARVALDLETTGLDPRQDKVRLLTLATEQGTWIVDCFKVDPQPLFSVLAEKKILIHNAHFDLGMLSKMGFELGENGKVLDTMLMSQLLAGQHLKGKEDE